MRAIRSTWRAAGTIMAAVVATSTVYAAAGQEKRPARNTAAGSQTPKEPKRVEVRYATIFHNQTTDVTDYTNAVMTDLAEGTVFRAEQMKVDNKKGAQTADATGNLLVTDKQADVTGEKAHIQYAKSKRLVTLTGKVTILVKPKSEQKDPTANVGPMPVALQNGKAKVEESDDDSDAPRKHPATITCDKVEYLYAKDKKHANLTGNFKVVQKIGERTRTLWADHAEWFGTEERLLLHAPVKWEDTKDNLKGESPGDVTVYTAEGNETIEMKGGGVVTLDAPEDDDETPAEKPVQKPPAGNPPPKTEEKKEPPKPAPDKRAQ